MTQAKGEQGMRFGVGWCSPPRTISKAVLLLLVTVAIVVPGQDQILAASGTWTTKAPMPVAWGNGAAGVVNGKLYVVGGGTSAGPSALNQSYDPATDTWATNAAIPTQTAYAFAAGIGSKLYVVGGCLFNGDCRIYTTNLLQIYDATTNTWSTGAPMPTPRSTMTGGVINGKIYVAGGLGPCPPCTFLNTLEVYDPLTNTWASQNGMPTAVASGAAGAIAGKLYVVGGSHFLNDFSSTLYVYDPTSGTWTTKAPMSTARIGLRAGVVNGILYAISGQNSTSYVQTVEAYDPGANSWTTMTPIPTARSGFGAGVINDVLYAVGGVNGTGALATNEALTNVVPFAAFSAHVAINNRQRRFAVGGRFTLGAGGSISLSPDETTIQDPVTLQLGGFSITIPGGSLHKDAYGNYVYFGTINGVRLAGAIRPHRNHTFGYAFGGHGANNLPSTNPVTVTLTVGNNTGSTSVHAFFHTEDD